LREVPDTTLLIAGPGSQERLTELAHRLGVQDHVRFLGLVERKKLLMLYAACDVFLLPGREVEGSAEGFGIVFLEAAFAGKPVIGGRQGGVPEAVADGETGLLVDGASVVEVAGAVVRLLRDPAYAQRLGASGRRRVMEQFDGRAQRESFARIVDRLLQRGKRMRL
jgi:phosphatidylinositol alpha-1,6-mannosyltransferase